MTVPGLWLSRLARRGPLHLTLWLIGLLWLVPSVGLLVTSFRTRPDIASSGWWTVFASPGFTLRNYQEVLGAQGMVDGFVNSLLITVPSTLLPVMIGALTAYAFTWLRFPGRDGLFLLVVALMVVPIQMTFVPVLRMLNALELSQSYVRIWLAHTAFGLPLVVFLLRNFFVLLPVELIEAARLDGASDLEIFARVVLPLSVPALASLTILQFLAVWNDLLMALVFIQAPTALPLTVRLSQMLSTYGTEWHLLSAGAFILMGIPLIVFFGLQRYFVQGLLAGSVK
jgi:alpha-glucoside transport system permease protein